MTALIYTPRPSHLDDAVVAGDGVDLGLLGDQFALDLVPHGLDGVRVRPDEGHALRGLRERREKGRGLGTRAR